MANFIDRVCDWVEQRPTETFGNYYYRGLRAILIITLVTGYIAGGLAGFVAVTSFWECL